MAAATLWDMAQAYAPLDDSIGGANLRLQAKGLGITLDEADSQELIAVARKYPLSRNGNGERVVQPLFDLGQSSVARFFESDPPPRRMLIDDFLPIGIVGLLASPGGVGKSVAAVQLVSSVATGVPFLGMHMQEVGAALYLAAEDDEGELHRRTRRVLEHYEAMGRVDRGAIAERLHIVSRVGMDNMLTVAGRDGDVARTALAERIIATVAPIPDVKLILLDPASRFKGGNGNDETAATKYIETLEAISVATGATVISSIHTNKAALKADTEPDQGVVRGSTALVDGARWVGSMQRLKKVDAKAYGVSAADADRYVRLDLVKTNYSRPWGGMWLRREAGGVLVPAELEHHPDAQQQERSQAKYDDVLERLRGLLRDEGPMTTTRICRDFAGTVGRLGAGKETVRSAISRALGEGELIAEPDPAGRAGQLVRAP